MFPPTVTGTRLAWIVPGYVAYRVQPGRGDRHPASDVLLRRRLVPLCDRPSHCRQLGGSVFCRRVRPLPTGDSSARMGLRRWRRHRLHAADAGAFAPRHRDRQPMADVCVGRCCRRDAAFEHWRGVHVPVDSDLVFAGSTDWLGLASAVPATPLVGRGNRHLCGDTERRQRERGWELGLLHAIVSLDGSAAVGEPVGRDGLLVDRNRPLVLLARRSVWCIARGVVPAATTPGVDGWQAESDRLSSSAA